MLPFLCRLTYIVNDGRKLKHVIDTTTFTYIRKNMSSSGRYRIRKLMTLSFILYDSREQVTWRRHSYIKVT